jgi:NADH-quinone oxidoreductase subunit M
MYLLLDTGMMGVFNSLDFFLFYVFWELMLLPMYFLIGIWGGPRKEYAAIKFFIYTLVGSVFMLLVMIGLYLSVGSFNMLDMMNPANFASDSIFGGFNTSIRYVAFIALFIGFAIKVPSVPFHTWLPDAHVEAPTPISVILAGVLLKMGTYGMLRIAFPIFPDAVGYFQGLIAWIGMISIVYGAFCALGQFKIGKRDLKKLIAYSSVSHMGYVMLGMASMRPEGIVGAIFQMFNHGIITAMLFMIVGVLYDRAHTRGLDEFGGIANKMPVYTGIMTIAFFAAIGLPGMSGFISEAMVFLGAFNTYPMLTMVSGLGIILGAAYMLWALQKVFFGQIPERWQGPWDPTGKKYKHDDINGRELTALIPLAVIVIFLGIMPNPIIDMMSASVNHFVEFMRPFVKIGGHLSGM